MFFDLFRIEDVKDGVSLCCQIVREEASMAAPPHCFSTHHRHAVIAREFK